ncbi:MAG: hypothetical protein WC620_11525 [Methanoregula sp.]
MRSGQFIHILAMVTFIACSVQPVRAEDEATTWYNIGEAYLERGEITRMRSQPLTRPRPPTPP